MCFQYAFNLIKYHKINKNNLKCVSIIKSFLNPYNWAGIEYLTVINKNIYTLFGKNNPLIVKVLQFVGSEITNVSWVVPVFTNIGKSDPQSYYLEEFQNLY